jgi:hypothetical protein
MQETLVSARRALRDEPLFYILFAALALLTIVGHWAAPIGPGQDYHYHLMVAALNARPSSDPVAALYHRIAWFDANTLIYRVAWPFEQLFDPVRAFGLAVLVTVYLGFPLAVAYALGRSGRARWAALFAFVVVYCKAWSINGFVPFYSASTFMVLSLAEWEALFSRRDPRARTAIVRGAIFSSCMFLAHGHVYAWTTLMLGLFTVFAMLRDVALCVRAEGAKGALRGARQAFELAWRSLAAIGPSLAMFGAWYLRTHQGVAAAQSNRTLVPVNPPIEQKLFALPAFIIHTRAEDEGRYVAAMVVVALAMMLLSRRSGRRAPWFESFSLLTIASYFALPETVNGQTIAPRHVDIAFWSLPLVLWAADSRHDDESACVEREAHEIKAPAPCYKRPTLEWALVALVFTFSWGRVRQMTRTLQATYARETGALVALAEPCRRAKRAPFSVLGYATMTRESAVMHSPLFHQAHETLAALCGVETPVYDTTIYPHNLLPLRYRVPMPAPVYVIERDPQWYSNALLWQKFDLVLTAEWTPSADDDARIAPVAELVATSGTFRLYRRRQ